LSVAGAALHVLLLGVERFPVAGTGLVIVLGLLAPRLVARHLTDAQGG
jgi:hypothetical protein